MTSSPFKNLSGLSNEILFLVVKELNELARASLFKLRLVFKRFDALVIPISYQSVTRNKLIFSSLGCEELDLICRDNILTNIRAHTRHLSIRENLKWDNIFRYISSMKHFRALRYSNLRVGSPVLANYRPDCLIGVHCRQQKRACQLPPFFDALHQA